MGPSRMSGLSPPPRCEGVVTPNEGDAVGVVWAEESPEVGALLDGTDQDGGATEQQEVLEETGYTRNGGETLISFKLSNSKSVFWLMAQIFNRFRFTHVYIYIYNIYIVSSRQYSNVSILTPHTVTQYNNLHMLRIYPNAPFIFICFLFMYVLCYKLFH